MSIQVKKIELNDEGLRKLMATVSEGNKYHVRVGVPSRVMHRKKKGEKKSASLVEIAFTHEFGNARKKIPERSFLRLGLERGKNRIIKVIGQEITKVLHDGVITFYKKGVEKSLERIGLQAQSEVKAVFKDNNWPKNAPSTYARKLLKGIMNYVHARSEKQREIALTGTVRPLIDTGQLVQSITSEVVKNV